MDLPDALIADVTAGVRQIWGDNCPTWMLTTALEVAAPALRAQGAAAERERCIKVVRDEAAVFSDEGWQASVRAALTECADLLGGDDG